MAFLRFHINAQWGCFTLAEPELKHVSALCSLSIHSHCHSRGSLIGLVYLQPTLPSRTQREPPWRLLGPHSSQILHRIFTDSPFLVSCPTNFRPLIIPEFWTLISGSSAEWYHWSLLWKLYTGLICVFSIFWGIMVLLSLLSTA